MCFGVYLYIKSFSSKKANIFRDRILEEKHRLLLLQILTEFQIYWRDQLKIEYTLVGGSVLGAYRHGEFVPYSDVIAVAVHRKYQSKIATMLLESRLLFIEHENHVSMILEDLHVRRYLGGFWPRVEVFFFEENIDGMILESTGFRYPKEIYYPFSELPFSDRIMPVPRCPLKYLVYLYGPNILDRCCVQGLNRQSGEEITSTCTSCSNLYHMFDFCRWESLNETHQQQQIHFHNHYYWKKGIVIRRSKCD